MIPGLLASFLTYKYGKQLKTSNGKTIGELAANTEARAVALERHVAVIQPVVEKLEPVIDPLKTVVETLAKGNP